MKNTTNLAQTLRQKPIIVLTILGVFVGLTFAIISPFVTQEVTVPSSGDFNKPTSNKIAISDTENEKVVVNNIYKSEVHTYESGTTVFQKSEYYQLTYSPSENLFNIVVLTSDFSTGRALAEAALVNELEISRAEACKLNVKIYTHPQLNPTEADKEYGLSFCD